jgi:hypothetical protein
MRRHCLSRPTWRPLYVVGTPTVLPFARYASIRTLGEPSLALWLGAFDEIRLFEPKALQSSERSSFRVDQVHLRTRLMLDPKRYLGQQPWPSSTLGRLAAVSWYLQLLLACLCSIASVRLSSLPPLFAPIGVVERIVDLCANPQAVQEHPESFLATATTARFFEFLPPREAIFSPWRLRSESFPNGPRM